MTCSLSPRLRGRVEEQKSVRASSAALLSGTRCDAASPVSCNQNQIWDLDFLTRSSTTFANLTIAATFAQGAKVFPEVLWDNAQLSGERVEVSADGRLSAVEGSPSLPIVSVSLFGRLYNEDAEQPVNFCPGQ